jgi:cell fate (sporulation/competence/biofilm development) regulator YlbF (YheA/YmcA/DUF963 family)
MEIKEMTILEAARTLGAAIQKDERYLKVMALGKANDSDPELQNLVGEFNMTRMSIDTELVKTEDRDEAKIQEYNETLRSLYNRIMENKSMVEFNKAKAEFDAVMQKANAIIQLCTEGEDPATCEPAEGCSGSCSTCKGCH